MAKKSTINQYKYDAAHCRNFHIKLNVAIDADIIGKLESVQSMQGYIKQLIRQDIQAPVPVSMCEAANEALKEEADKRSMDPGTLARIIINEWLINNSII